MGTGAAGLTNAGVKEQADTASTTGRMRARMTSILLFLTHGRALTAGRPPCRDAFLEAHHENEEDGHEEDSEDRRSDHAAEHAGTDP
jgi:hypothetical protein